MKRVLILCLSLLCLVCLFGCDQQTESPSVTTTAPTAAPTTQPTTAPTTEPATEPTTVPVTEPVTEPVLSGNAFGISMAGMTRDEALKALQDAAASYVLTLNVNTYDVPITAQDLNLKVSEAAFDHWFADPTSEPVGVLEFTTERALKVVKDSMSFPAKNPQVIYKDGKFQLGKQENGVRADPARAEPVIIEAASKLTATAKADIATLELAPDIPASDPRVQDAVAAINSYLSLKLTYHYEAEGVTTADEAIDRDTLASFLKVSSDYVVLVNENAVWSYVNRMASSHGGSYRNDDFITTYGSKVSYLKVDYYGITLDKDKMVQDIVSCIQNRTSGTRTAPYMTGANADRPFRGNYIEIDLTNQWVWLYKDGKVLVSTHMTSGDVSTNTRTRVGVFEVFCMAEKLWLMGPTWSAWANYWMQFDGGIGLHDATWRDHFGGNIYLYDGSHGCLNMPLSAARTLYQNIEVGYKVVVHGGRTSTEPLTQEITGTGTYRVTTDSDSFKLDFQEKYINRHIIYESSDTSVVKVSETGVVTVIGPGTATVTIISEERGCLSRAEFPVEIIVTDPNAAPEVPSEPEVTEPEDTTNPEDTNTGSPENTGSGPVTEG